MYPALVNTFSDDGAPDWVAIGSEERARLLATVCVLAGQHPDLSLRARGALVRITTNPDINSIDDLAARSVEGRDAVAATVNELVTAGYLRREHSRDAATGRFVRRWVIQMPESAPDQGPLPVTGLDGATAAAIAQFGYDTRWDRWDRREVALMGGYAAAALMAVATGKPGQASGILAKLDPAALDEVTRQAQELVQSCQAARSTPARETDGSQQ